jgi:hypothetical protein
MEYVNTYSTPRLHILPKKPFKVLPARCQESRPAGRNKNTAPAMADRLGELWPCNKLAGDVARATLPPNTHPRLSPRFSFFSQTTLSSGGGGVKRKFFWTLLGVVLPATTFLVLVQPQIGGCGRLEKAPGHIERPSIYGHFGLHIHLCAPRLKLRRVDSCVSSARLHRRR